MVLLAHRLLAAFAALHQRIGDVMGTDMTDKKRTRNELEAAISHGLRHSQSAEETWPKEDFDATLARANSLPMFSPATQQAEPVASMKRDLEKFRDVDNTECGRDWFISRVAWHLDRAAPPAVQAEPTQEMIADAWVQAQGKCDHDTLRSIYRVFAVAPAQQPHIDPITPDDRKRYYDFEKYADHLPTCKQPRGDQFCECGYSAVRTNLSDLLDELAAPAQQEPPQQSAEPVESAFYKIAAELAMGEPMRPLNAVLDTGKSPYQRTCNAAEECADRLRVMAMRLRNAVDAAPPADDEAVRLLQWARASANTSKELRAAIDAYLAKVTR